MKINTFTHWLFAAMTVLGTGDLFGQSAWIKDTRNPIFIGGGTGSWDHHVFMSNVLYNADSARYEMWYSGSYGPPWRPYRIGFAWSADGINWMKYSENPVLVPDPGSWDEGSVEAARVIRENGLYKLWYAGVQNSISQVGYATSPDGMHWTKYAGNPVLRPASAGWEAGSVYTGAVLPTPKGYTMFYEGAFKVGRATSVDGVNWQKDTVNSPVLREGTSGQWDDGAVFSTCVFPVNGTLVMLYIGSRSGLVLRQGGLAISTDEGVTWTKNVGNPVLRLGTPGSWDASHVEPGTMLARDGIFELWYDGTIEPSDVNLWKIGHATSSASTLRLVPAQYSKIQAAIDAALQGDTVLVEEGTYYENVRYRGKRIVVGSRYVLDKDTSHNSRTIINGGSSANPDSGSAVYFVNGEDTTSVLCGFTITGGTGTKVSPGLYYPSDIRGGGVFLSRAGARLSHNILSNNTVSTSGSLGVYGGGIGAFGDGTSFMVIEDNDISHNSTSTTFTHAGGGGIAILGVPARIRGNIVADNAASTQASNSNTIGGGIAAVSPNLLVLDNVIARNKSLSPNGLNAAWGGGIHVVNTNMQFRNNKVLDNLVLCASTGSAYGGGVSVAVSNEQGAWPQDEIVIEANLISGNVASGADWCTGGGISITNEKPLIQNNIIVKNSAFSGGGLGITRNNYVTTFAPALINNTITANKSTSNVGGGIASRGAWTPSLINCIAWGDTGTGEIALFDGGSINVAHSDVQGGWQFGSHNIDVDPMFDDSTFRLSDASLCIGHGTDSAQVVTSWYFDFYGSPRPNPANSNPDIGACENPLANPITGIAELPRGVPVTFALEQNYPNPFNPLTIIHYTVGGTGGSPFDSFAEGAQSLRVPPDRAGGSGTRNTRLVVYDLLGRVVATLVNEVKQPGAYAVEFDALGLASGVYIYRMTAGSYVQSRRMILLK